MYQAIDAYEKAISNDEVLKAIKYIEDLIIEAATNGKVVYSIDCNDDLINKYPALKHDTIKDILIENGYEVYINYPGLVRNITIFWDKNIHNNTWSHSTHEFVSATNIEKKEE